MGLDNIIGIFVQPLMGFFSDRTRSRWGRRTPFIVIGAPIAALLFMLIPLAPSFPILIAVIVLFSLTANSFKPITESLIADNQLPEHRSKANAFGRAASSLTIIVSALLSLFVVDESVELAYVIAAVVMVACFAILLISLRESAHRRLPRGRRRGSRSGPRDHGLLRRLQGHLHRPRPQPPVHDRSPSS